MSKEKTTMTYKEHMYQFLNSQLEPGETLLYPIYGTLVQPQMTYHGYFAFTEKRLLVALLNGAKFEIAWTLHTPLDILRYSLKKSFVPGQRVLRIDFKEGKCCHLILPGKVRGIDCQKENLEKFLTHLDSIAPRL